MSRLFFLILYFITASVSANVVNNYILDTGDEIKIVVYDEPDLTIETVINDDGFINFPLIGSVSVKGKTTSQVQKIIHSGLLGDYLLNPSVQVDIITYRPFYIHGEVKKPGAYPYQPGMRIDQAVSIAGGLTERASKNKIYIKKSVSNEVSKKNVNLTTPISAGDTIIIEQSFF